MATCVICGEDVDSAVDSYAVSTAFLGVDMPVARNPTRHDLRIVHLACWQVRQLVPDVTDNPGKMRGMNQAPDAKFTPAAQCGVCGTRIDADTSRVTLRNMVRPGAPRALHLGCFCTAYNPRTQLFIGPEASREAVLCAWMRKLQRPVYQMEVSTYNVMAAFDMAIMSMSMCSVIKMIKEKAEAMGELFRSSRRESLANYVRSVYTEQAAAVDGASPAMRLYSELIAKGSQSSPLSYMHKYGLVGRDMLLLGLNSGMIDVDKDWDILLDKSIFEPRDLVHGELGLTFPSMLYRGLGISKFCRARYFLNDLQMLQFGARGFYASKGTEEDMRELAKSASCEVADIKKIFFERRDE